jgi:hypothetical protein
MMPSLAWATISQVASIRSQEIGREIELEADELARGGGEVPGCVGSLGGDADGASQSLAAAGDGGRWRKAMPAARTMNVGRFIGLVSLDDRFKDNRG